MTQEISNFSMKTKDQAISDALNYCPQMRSESSEDIEQWALAGKVEVNVPDVGVRFMDFSDWKIWVNSKK